MKLTPWYKVVTPRDDLREGKPLDASEFAVHLDQVRDGSANPDYQNPKRFFERTFLTNNLLETASEVLRRLSGEKTGTNAVFNMATQFGGGKTHALTLLYHLASLGPEAAKLTGVEQITKKAGVNQIPKCATAVFVGTEFDSITGRGGDDGTPLRKTPWGEIAFQLNGEEGFQAVAEHEKALTAPGGDVIRKILPTDKPSIILIDELLNYINRTRKSGLAGQLYSFLHELSETARGGDNIVLVASIPASELEMTAEDESDYKRFKKLLDRLGKAVVMSSENEASEIIRRRLFEWSPQAVGANGKVMLSRQAIDACSEFADWLCDHKAHVPDWFSVDQAQKIFEASYPFHPMVLSVFERKWQELPSFQQTRGILRLLALWVSRAYKVGFKGAQKDAVIGIGTAPIDDPMFRTAVFEQLGAQKLEGAVTTDIAGKADSHAVRLDEEAVDTIRKARLHRKVATTIFFESNGGQSRNEATVPEIRLAVSGPDADIGNVETALGALTDACYYLTSERNRYRFSLKENLNKRYADRRASVKEEEIDSKVKDEIQKVFSDHKAIQRLFFPDNSAQIPDRPTITMAVIAPESSRQDDARIKSQIEVMTKEHGKAGRTYKSSLIWIVPETSSNMYEEARKLLAWEDIRDEGLNLDEGQQKLLDTSIKKARRDLTESIWRAYKNIMILGRDNRIEMIDLGVVTSSQAESLPKLILNELLRKDIAQKSVSPRYLTRNWPFSSTEWSTKSVRDAFYASPKFPRILDSESVKDTIARGVCDGLFAYAFRSVKGGYDPLIIDSPMSISDVEISDDVFILTPEEARRHLEPPRLAVLQIFPTSATLKPGNQQAYRVEGLDQFGNEIQPGNVTWNANGGVIDGEGVFTAGTTEGKFYVSVSANGKTATADAHIQEMGRPTPVESGETKKIIWEGKINHRQWSNYYMKVLRTLVAAGNVKLSLRVEAELNSPNNKQVLEDIKAALRNLDLDDKIDIK